MPNLVAVLQMALLYAAIANGGKLLLPQLVERIESPNGQVLEEFAPQIRREISVSPENLAIIRQALLGVVAKWPRRSPRRSSAGTSTRSP